MHRPTFYLCGIEVELHDGEDWDSLRQWLATRLSRFAFRLFVKWLASRLGPWSAPTQRVKD